MSGLADALDEIAGGLTVATPEQVVQVEKAVDRLMGIARDLREQPQTRAQALQQAREWGETRSHHNTMMAMENYLPPTVEGEMAQPDRQLTLVRIAQADAAEVQRLAALATMLPDDTHALEVDWAGVGRSQSMLAAVTNGDLSTFIAEQLVAAKLVGNDVGAVQRVVQRSIDAWRRTVEP